MAMKNPQSTQFSSPVLEWRIENFSCWRKSVHGNAIICRESSLIAEGKIELCLFPKGYDSVGISKGMEVTFVGPNNLFRKKGLLSFVGPDGSLLCTQRVNEVLFEIPNRVLGPKFGDVVSLIEKKENLHGDHLTLQFQYKNLPENRIYMRTTLEVLDNSYQITQPLEGRSSRVKIASVSYHESDVEKRIQVTCDTVSKLLYLKIVTENNNRSFVQAVQCQVSEYDNSNVLVTREKREFTFIIPKAITSSFQKYILKLKNSGNFILRLKIISGNYRSHCHDIFQSTSPIKNAVSLIKSNSLFSLSEDLRCLYQDREFPDFQLKCGTVSFPVHKNILRTRSPVFKTMLSCDMIEAASGSVDIEDLDAASLDHFLTYLYTGTFKDVDCDRALQLYYAADKYQVSSLKEECAHFLSANVCISNVCDILCLGDIYEDDQLTSAAQNFILKHYMEVLRSKEWQHHMNTNSKLLVKTLTHFAANGYGPKFLLEEDIDKRTNGSDKQPNICQALTRLTDFWLLLSIFALLSLIIEAIR